MPKRPRIEPFFLVVKDNNKGLFNVIGPMTDDTSWNNRVYEAQERGLNVNCYTAARGQTREEIISNVERELRLKYTDERIV